MRFYWFLVLIGLGILFSAHAPWGFYGHRKITRLAITTLPSELMIFYKKNSEIIIEKSVAPDQRRYVIEAEGPLHFIDLDDYDHLDSIPKYWSKAVERYGEAFLESHGHGPWYTYYTYQKLVKAYASKDYDAIIRTSCDLAHYIADANVPLHTTSNYNGQFTGQEGIHGFWETRLPQLFSDNYDFLVGRAEYVADPQGAIWDAVFDANALVDSVFIVEKLATVSVGEDKKFAYEDSRNRTIRVYSEKYATEYHRTLPVVEQQMQRSIKMIGDFWYTAWIEAGQPVLIDISPGMKGDTLKLDQIITPKRLHEH